MPGLEHWQLASDYLFSFKGIKNSVGTLHFLCLEGYRVLRESLLRSDVIARIVF